MSSMKLILQAFLLSAFLVGLSQGDKCPSGPNQSPINLDASTATHDATQNLVFNSQNNEDSTWVAITNTGETLTLEATKGDHFQSSISIDAKQYDLQKFVYHWGGSEHAIEGEIKDGEIHYIYKNKEDESLVVMSILLEKTEDSFDLNLEGWREMISAIVEANTTVIMEVKNPGLVATTVQQGLHLFRYTGTLTAPPCSIAERIVLSRPTPSPKGIIDGLKTLKNNEGDLLTASVNRALQTSTNSNPVYKNFA